LSHDPKKSATFWDHASAQSVSDRAGERWRPGPHWGLQDQAVDTVALMFEIGEHAAVEFAGAGKLDPHRIDEMPIHQDLVMEMRPCREPCLAEITNDLALPHMGAFGRATGNPDM